MTDELNEESTPEEIDAKVDEVIANKAEEATAEKSDSQKIAEGGDQAATQLEDKTETEEVSEQEETEEESDEQEWLDADLKKQITAYGIDEKELEGFTSREEVERAMRFLDRSAQEAGKKPPAEKTPEKAETEEAKPEGQFEIKLDPEIWDEGMVEEFTRMRDHYDDLASKSDARVEALEARFAEADAELEEQKFDVLIDSLGHKDLFGTTGKETKKELNRKEELIFAAKAQQIGLEQLGRPVELDGALMARVANMVFADELGKKKLKARTRKVAKQSDRRMGGSATKAHETTESVKDEMNRLYEALEGAG